MYAHTHTCHTCTCARICTCVCVLNRDSRPYLRYRQPTAVVRAARRPSPTCVKDAPILFGSPAPPQSLWLTHLHKGSHLRHPLSQNRQGFDPEVIYPFNFPRLLRCARCGPGNSGQKNMEKPPRPSSGQALIPQEAVPLRVSDSKGDPLPALSQTTVIRGGPVGRRPSRILI